MKKIGNFLWILVLVLISLSCLTTRLAFAANLSLSLDRTKVNAGETLSLELASDTRLGGKAPEFVSALPKGLKIVSGPSTQFFTRTINGQRTSSATWQWTLKTSQAGTFTIPAMDMSGFKSNQLKLTVVKAKTTPKTQGKLPEPVFITAEVDVKNPIQYQQVIVSWKVHFRQNIQGDIGFPDIPSQIRQQKLSEDSKNYVSTIDGNPYEIYEFKMAIFPTQPGDYTIQPMRFNGRKQGVQRGYNRWEPIDLFSNAVEISVQQKPAQYRKKPLSNQWLPASRVNLSAGWQIPKNGIEVGDPITLELNYIVKDQLAEFVPKIKLPSVKNLRIYPEKVDTKNDIDWNNGITAYKNQNITVIPSAPGKFKLPDITYRWWNTQSNKAETIQIPGQSIQVSPGSGNQSGSPAQNLQNMNLSAANLLQMQYNNLKNQAKNVQANQQANQPFPPNIPMQAQPRAPIKADVTEKQTVAPTTDIALWQYVSVGLGILLLFVIITLYRVIFNLWPFGRRESSQAVHTTETDQPLQKTQKKITPKQIQLSLLPYLEKKLLLKGQEDSTMNCRKLIQTLNDWVEQESGHRPPNLSQLQDAIVADDPWQPLLKQTEAFLYGGADSWPMTEIKLTLNQGLPQVKKPLNDSKTNNSNGLKTFSPPP